MPPDPFANALILTGPTASGKTALALDLAEAVGAEIVAMDSMTHYRGMDVGTAKPSAAERARVPHHLLDLLDPWESASVAWWLDQAADAVRDVERRGKRALFVGGTPLYLKALAFGLFDGPPAHAELRRRLENEPDLHARLTRVDPVTADRLHPNDTRRLVRALEVWELTGRPISSFQQEWQGESSLAGRCVWIDLPRTDLYARIDRRVVQMLEQGLLEEVSRLRSLPRPVSRVAAQALGYKELFAHLDGAHPLAEAIRLIQTRTRQFAKRQLTWLRHLPGCKPVDGKLTTALPELRIG